MRFKAIVETKENGLRSGKNSFIIKLVLNTIFNIYYRFEKILKENDYEKKKRTS